MSDLWFTRATLKTGSADVAPLLNTLLATDASGHGRDTTHRLLWTLMPESMQGAGKLGAAGGDRAAFLWCRAPDREKRPAWYVLGPAPRADAALFEVESKPWSLAPSAGDRLLFELTVHATVDRMLAPEQGREGRKRIDVVLDAILAAEREGEAAARAEIRRERGEKAMRNWWASQGARCGFTPLSTAMVDYHTLPLGRSRTRGRNPVQLGIARLNGTIEVTDPAAFAHKVAVGFGRAKAFGCGLMLLRRSG